MLTKLINIGVAVNDIDAAIARYQENFGATVVKPVADQPALNIQYAVIKIGNAELELFSPLPGEAVLRNFLDTRGEGLYRLAFAADDFDATLSHLDSKGIRYMKAEVNSDVAASVAFLSPKAGQGVMFELVQEQG